MNIIPSTAINTTNGLTAYITQLKTQPHLSQDEEKALFKQFHNENNLDAARKIIMSHLRFVVYIAKNYAGYGIPLEDIIQEGNIGLMKSVKRFDISYGVRLATFATYWIKSEIHEFILKNWRLVKVATTKAQRKLFFGLRKAKKSLVWLSQEEATQIATDLNVNTKDVFEMESRLHQHDCFFNESFDESKEENVTGLAASPLCLEDCSTQPDSLCEAAKQEVIYNKVFQIAIENLDDRSRDIIESRWFAENKLGLKELSKRHGVSMERIRQIEASAMQKIKKLLPEKNSFTA